MQFSELVTSVTSLATVTTVTKKNTEMAIENLIEIKCDVVNYWLSDLDLEWERFSEFVTSVTSATKVTTYTVSTMNTETLI